MAYVDKVNPQWIIAAECDAWEDELRDDLIRFVNHADIIRMATKRLGENGTTEANAARLRGVIVKASRLVQCAECRTTGHDAVAEVHPRGSEFPRLWGCVPCVDRGVAANQIVRVG